MEGRKKSMGKGEQDEEKKYTGLGKREEREGIRERGRIL